ELLGILNAFKAPIRYALAYGSGAYTQRGYDAGAPPMIDFLFGVTHPEHWHSLNMRQHGHHYASTRVFGAKSVSYIQERFGAGCYFLPDVAMNGRQIKYGVVSIDRLIADLHHWDSLYLAGRCHKPVRVLRDDPRVKMAQRRNRRSAVRTALLLLPEQFSETELFMTIAGLSYHGDFRMKVGGENPHKVFNIVHEQRAIFRKIYGPIVEDLPDVRYVDDATLVQDRQTQARVALIAKLPQNLVNHLHNQLAVRLERAELEWLATSPKIQAYTATALEEIVFRPALVQAFKGFFSAGFRRSIAYAWAKLMK
ncbi:hypothetical protein CXG81DRAFT_3673, partial [Caulochytrium protostelioides]